MERKNEIFVKCECYSEAIEINHWQGEENFYFSFWSMGRSRTYQVSWRDRFGMVWKILRGKDLYSDMVILDHNKAKELADFINTEIENVQSDSSEN